LDKSHRSLPVPLKLRYLFVGMEKEAVLEIWKAMNRECRQYFEN
jgi:hypothetical protein